MMTNTILTQETINKASYKELQAFAKANGMQSSGKGITAEFLRNQLLNLIATEEPISDNSIPVGDLDITRDNAPAENVSALTNNNANKSSSRKKTKLAVLVQDKATKVTSWEYKESKLLKKAPMSNEQILQVLESILVGNEKYKSIIFQFSRSKDENVKGKDFMEAYKLKAIFESVMQTDDVSIFITYFRQMRYIAKAELNDGTRYIVGNKMREALEQLRKLYPANTTTEAAAE